MPIPRVGVRFTAEGDEVALAIRDLTQSIKESGRASKSSRADHEKLGRTLRRVAVRAAALVGGFELLRRTTRFIVGTAKEFEQLEARLVSVTGSSEDAVRAFDLIKEFARTTPFEIQNLVEAFTDLSAIGIEPTRDQLRDLGNFAAAFGRDITELSSAVIKAGAGNSRELQKFGVIARAEGEKLVVTFRGVTHEVERDFESVLELMQEISRNNFGDAMERQMGTLGGATSNLQDSMSILADRIGDRGVTAELTRLVRYLDDGIASSGDFADVVGGAMAGAIGTATDALILLNEHGRVALVILQALGGAAVARGVVFLGARLAAAAVAGGGLGAAIVGLLGGPVGAVLTLASAVAVPLLLNLEKASKEAEGLVNVVRSFRSISARDTPLAIGNQISRANELIEDLEAKIEDLGSRRTATGGLLSEDVVDPEAAAEAAELQRELDGLIEHRKGLVRALDDQARAQAALREEEQKTLTEEQLKKIQSVIGGLEQQVDSLTHTERELLEKKLAEIGAGQATTEHALALFDQAAALREQEEALKDTRAQLERLPDVEQALLAAQGDTVGALRLELQSEFGDLIRVLLSQADFAGVTLVQNLINTRLARARLQELEDEFGAAREALSIELERIELEHQAGAITATEAQDRIRAAYQRQLDVLNELLPVLRAAAEATGDPKAIARVQAMENELRRLGIALERIGDNVDDFTARAREALEQDLVSFLTSGIDEAENLGAAFQNLATSIIQSIRRIAAEIAARAVLRAIFPTEFAEGGAVGGADGFAEGGQVRGPGGPTSDTVPAMLSPGEYVVRAAAVKRVGVQALEEINRGARTPRFIRHGRQLFAEGGFVEELPRRRAAASSQGGSRERPPAPVFNIAIHSTEDPRQIAREVTEELIETAAHSPTLQALFSGGN